LACLHEIRDEVRLNDEHVGAFRVGNLLMHERRRAEHEFDRAAACRTEPLGDLHERWPQRAVTHHLELVLRFDLESERNSDDEQEKRLPHFGGIGYRMYGGFGSVSGGRYA